MPSTNVVKLITLASKSSLAIKVTPCQKSSAPLLRISMTW